MTAYVYRAFNAEGVLLYIGSSVSLGYRMKSHAHNSRWWLKAKRFTFEAFDSELVARIAEAQAIRTEHPRWNIRERSPLHPDGPAADYVDILANYPDDCRWGMGKAPMVLSISADRKRRRAQQLRAS